MEDRTASEVRQRMAKAVALVDTVLVVARKAMMECEEGHPAIALAGRFAFKGGCGCTTCIDRVGDAGEGVLGLRKCALSDVEQEVLARFIRSGWGRESVREDPEQKLEWSMASWFSAFCCLVVTKCGAGVHPYVFQVLETYGAHGSRKRILQGCPSNLRKHLFRRRLP